MKKLLFLAIHIFLVLVSYSQNAKPDLLSLPDSIRKYFNYDTLRHISCLETPPGVYALIFKVNNRGIAYDYEFSPDSLPVLKGLFSSALERALNRCPLPIVAGKYIQLIYYNNFLRCLDKTPAKNEENIQKQISDLLANQLYLIEKSISNIGRGDSSQYIVLKAAVINNMNPNRPEAKTGFRNDTRKGNPKELPAERIEKIRQAIEKKRKETI